MGNKYQEPYSISVGPYVGMNDTVNLAAQDADRFAYGENIYTPSVTAGGDVMSRPGTTRLGLGSAVSRTGTISIDAGGTVTGTGTLFTTELAVGDVVTWKGNDYLITVISGPTTASANAAGDGSATAAYTYYPAGISGGIVYHVGQYQNTSGTTRRYAIVKTTNTRVDGGGAGRYRMLGASAEKLRLVEYDPSNATHPWTDRTSVSMNGVSLDITVRIYSLNFANYWVVSDGVNRIRLIDSSFVMTNSTDGNYVAQGPLTNYYGKLFLVDSADKATLRWSEENDPNTGFGTGTSDNSWTLRQTSSDTIQGIIGTNDALYVFRNNSTTLVYGAANTDFRSAGTLDAVSTTIGTRSPDAICLAGNAVCFMDQYGRPARIEPGAGYVSMYDRIQEQLRGIGGSDSQLRATWARLNPALNLLHIGYRATTSATTNDQMLVFDVRTWECVGLWKYYSSGTTAMDHAYGTVWLDTNNKPRLVVADGTTGNCAVMVSKTEDDQAAAATDTLAAGDQTVAVTLETQKIGGHVVLQKAFYRVDVGYRNVGGYTTSYKLQYRTPYGNYAAAKAMNQPTQGNTFDKDTVKAVFKTDGLGRWVQYKFTNDTTGNPTARFTLDTVTASGAMDTDDFQSR